MTWEMVKIASIIRDPEVQQRVQGVDQALANEYAEALEDGGELPAVVVFREPKTGRLWLSEGFHRVAAHELAGRDEIKAVVNPGDKRKAILHAVGANDKHGKRRTREDIRRAVETLLKDAEWGQWSDREIARRANVHHNTAAKHRAHLAKSPDAPLGTSVDGGGQRMVKVERAGTEYTMALPKRPEAGEPAPTTGSIVLTVPRLAVGQRVVAAGWVDNTEALLELQLDPVDPRYCCLAVGWGLEREAGEAEVVYWPRGIRLDDAALRSLLHRLHFVALTAWSEPELAPEIPWYVATHKPYSTADAMRHQGETLRRHGLAPAEMKSA